MSHAVSISGSSFLSVLFPTHRNQYCSTTHKLCSGSTGTEYNNLAQANSDRCTNCILLLGLVLWELSPFLRIPSTRGLDIKEGKATATACLPRNSHCRRWSKLLGRASVCVCVCVRERERERESKPSL